MPRDEKQSKQDRSKADQQRPTVKIQVTGRGLFKANELPPVPDSARQPPSAEPATLFNSGKSGS